MEIFYTAAYSGKETYQKYYDMVLKALENTGVTVVSPEKGNYMDLLTKKELANLTDPRQKHYAAIKKGILSADAVVIEISEENFQLGHEATLAIQSKKHVLCLSIHEDFSVKIQNRYFHAAKYNQFNIEEIVGNFINRVKGESLDVRFNLFLSDRQVQYLNEVCEKEGINKSEYIRKLLDADCLRH